MGHPLHTPCRLWLDRANTPQGDTQGIIHVHSLAEAFSVLSGSPFQPRFSSRQVKILLQDNLAHFEVIVLTPDEYWDTLERVTTLGFSGGAVFDALLAQAASKARADVLLTLNAKHFVRLGEDVAKIVQVPE